MVVRGAHQQHVARKREKHAHGQLRDDLPSSTAHARGARATWAGRVVLLSVYPWVGVMRCTVIILLCSHLGYAAALAWCGVLCCVIGSSRAGGYGDLTIHERDAIRRRRHDAITDPTGSLSHTHSLSLHASVPSRAAWQTARHSPVHGSGCCSTLVV